MKRLTWIQILGEFIANYVMYRIYRLVYISCSIPLRPVRFRVGVYQTKIEHPEQQIESERILFRGNQYRRR